MSSAKTKNVMTGFLCLAFLGCSTSFREPPVEQWPELQFIVDGKIEIQLRVPPAEMKADLSESQFFSTALEPIQTMMFASYDPGKWSNRGLLLTRIVATVFRIEPKSSPGSTRTLEDIKNNIYLSRPDAANEFDIEDEVTFNDRDWLRVNLISGYRRGIAYSTIVGQDYALVIGMSIFGEDSDQTRLFQTRHETLKEVIGSTKIWPQ